MKSLIYGEHICVRCRRAFRTSQGLGLHIAHRNKAGIGKRAQRLCPERRSVTP